MLFASRRTKCKHMRRLFFNGDNLFGVASACIFSSPPVGVISCGRFDKTAFCQRTEKNLKFGFKQIVRLQFITTFRRTGNKFCWCFNDTGTFSVDSSVNICVGRTTYNTTFTLCGRTRVIASAAMPATQTENLLRLSLKNIYL